MRADATTDAASRGALLELTDVSVRLHRGGRKSKDTKPIVDSVSLRLARGQTIGVVGESGSGKTTLARAMLRLVPIASGRVVIEGTDITHMTEGELRGLRRYMQMIFQNPLTSLDPRMTIGDAIAEPLLIHKLASRVEARERSRELLEIVGLNPDHVSRYPQQFSGGQRQRISIARALALNPSLIVADEPTSALDVSMQGQIANLLKELQARFDLGLVLISHDLGLVRMMADDVIVMSKGQVVENAPVDEIFSHARHPYTQELLNSIRELRERKI